jgi:hypothetical protein
MDAPSALCPFGLSNLGSSCFFNAAVQGMLAALRRVSSHLLDGRPASFPATLKAMFAHRQDAVIYPSDAFAAFARPFEVFDRSWARGCAEADARDALDVIAQICGDVAPGLGGLKTIENYGCTICGFNGVASHGWHRATILLCVCDQTCLCTAMTSTHASLAVLMCLARPFSVTSSHVRNAAKLVA